MDRPATMPARGDFRSGRQAKGASTAVDTKKRAARNAKSGNAASDSWTGTNVYPQMAVTTTRASVGARVRTARSYDPAARGRGSVRTAPLAGLRGRLYS